MSIAAAENAGLGPCDLPLSDPWVTHTTQTSAGVCSLPLSSPASVTAAVAVSSAVSAVSLGGNYLQTNSTNTVLLQHQVQQQQIQQQTSSAAAVLQHSPQAKIMNAVATAVPCPTPASSRKIRRKTENKPQSQINKCNNEKRRRELENNYIEQLGEFLQLNKRGDMTSTKPDKAAILNQVVKTYRDICDKGTNRDNTTTSRCTRCPNNCADTCTLHPVQQGEVSSTEPPIPESSRVNGQPPEISAYFEALEHYISCVGWVLLQINTEGIIESCTKNIKDLIGYDRSELQKQPIYSYLHTGDHNKLGPILSNMSFQLGWGGEQEDQHHKNRRGITAKVRMLVKHPEGSNETMEQKQQRQDKYEEVVLIAAPVKDDGDDSSTVLCLITRPEEESSIDTNMQQHTQQRSPDQLTLKLDKMGKILQVDANDFRPSYQFSKETGRSIQELCHMQDWHRLQAHLKEVQTSQSHFCFSSAPFRLRLGAPDVYVHVKANSRLFLNTTPGETDYIMCILTVLSGNDLNSIEPNPNAVSGVGMTSNMSIQGVNQISSLPSTSHHHTSTTNVGGPLMTSVINGTVPPVQVSPRTNSVVTTFSSPPSVSESTTFFPETFDFDFPGWESRPDSRTSITPVSTSRPPSVQAYSPAGQNVCSSPLAQYHTPQNVVVSQPSPQNNNNGNMNINTNNNNNNGGFHSFGFTNFDDKDQKDHLNNNNNSNNNNNHSNSGAVIGPNPNVGGNQNHDSERLRNLLTLKRSQGSASSSGVVAGVVGDDQDSRNTHRILKGLLNAEEDKDGNAYTKLNNALNVRMNAQRPRTADSKNSENPMLLQMLNDRSDEGITQSELLRQLKRDDTPKDHNTTSNNQTSTEELKNLLRIKGNDYINRKRPLNEPDDGTVPKRSEDKPSQLREKNKMLASLLENPSKAPPPTVPNPVVKIIPDIPSRVSSSSAIGPGPPSGVGAPGTPSSMMSLQNKPPTPGQPQATTTTNLHANPSTRGIRKPSDAYLNQPQMQPQADQAKNQLMLSQAQSPSTSSVQRPQTAASFASSLDPSPYASSTTSTSSSSPLSVASSTTQSKQLDSVVGSLVQHLQSEFDPELTKLLNELVDFAPDFDSTNQSVGNSQEENNKLLAIKKIEKSLMQFESNSFSNSPPAYPMMSGIVGPQQGAQPFQPPPVYTQRSARLAQMSGLRQQQFHRERLLQQQQKERLLQQQQKQRMVVPESATACADQLSLNPGMSNIGSLLNNTVAPNVSLARSTLPDSQLSPGFPQNLIQQQLSPSQRGAPFSPQQGQGYQPSFPNNAQRLSPQQQQQLSQVQQQQQQQQQPQISFPTGTNTNTNAQLSPIQPPFNVTAQPVSGAVVQTAQGQPTQQWNLGNSRISLQQHNPMLSAQLQNVGYNPRQFQTQRRSLNSPGATVTRQNSFQGQDGSGFPGPPSPSPQGPFGTTTNVFNNQQLQRIQRQSSVPQATQHLPGSPRSFGGSDYGMMYNNMQHAAQGPPPPNDFYGRTQTGNGMNSSEYVRQELRAVVSGRTQQTANSGTVPGGGGGVNAGGTGMRTPQSPLGGLGQGPMVGTTNTNAMGGMAQQTQQQQPQQTTAQQQIPGNALLNTSPDTIYNFENVTDFFGGNSTR
ncbi:nuclear receptor coactivator 3 isoform X2 [Hermetia illucens]|nr:nuclear receptor coactivator 3 isoform X2 [Hermetia illucens]XP_037909325.1 nuclear receptor coactivator 3 isoform X2 [Hermetia illucens]XP_037909326.1 nuclear receptor coactivator 3 isoform X2 [Hermetia illucens]XP_037909327.1 nuclear receptor coactivator 3 isoform X2 [Hermetia illucens]